MARKLTSTADHTIRNSAGKRWDITAKDFPDAGERGEFRVYEIRGDINDLGPNGFQDAVSLFLTAHGVEGRRVIITR